MPGHNATTAGDRNRLIDITLDAASISSSSPEIVHEREVAIYDILDGNTFAVAGREDGPYRLNIGMAEERLALTVTSDAAEPIVTHQLSMTPFKRILKDYFLILDTYYKAIRTAPPSKIQAIDMGRRGLHDEGSRVLMERLEGKISIDFDTARRLFTLIAALQWKG